MITIAIPRGRLFQESVDLLFERNVIRKKIEEGRKLTVSLDGVELLLVKPLDLPLYVESGTADLGICGLDVYLEKNPDVYRLLDLKLGACRISVAGKPESRKILERCNSPVVATKYPNITKKHFTNKGISPRIIEMSGSVELGAVLGIADFIVDLVQTGRTLKENGLVEIEVIDHSSGWLICNRASFRNKREEITRILQALQTP